MLSVQANSQTGSDQGWNSRGSNAVATNDDPIKAEFNNAGMQPSTNRGDEVAARVAKALGACTNKREAQSIGNLIKAGRAKMSRT